MSLGDALACSSRAEFVRQVGESELSPFALLPHCCQPATTMSITVSTLAIHLPTSS